MSSPTVVQASPGTGLTSSVDGRIARIYHDAASYRDQVLTRARKAAQLTLPEYLPPQGRSQGDELPRNYQSMGSHGVSNLVGKMLTAAWPVGIPWMTYELAPEIRYSPSISNERKQRMVDELYIREMLVQAAVESIQGSGPRRPSSFRSTKRSTLGHIVVTGESFEYLSDRDSEFRLRNYRRDHYVTIRDGEGNPILHVTLEQIDPLSLDEKKLEKSKLDRKELEDQYAGERMQNLWTMVEWNPTSKTWVIYQECNGNEIAKRQERVTPFFSTPYSLVTPDHYGIGLVEHNLGDLSGFDELSERTLEFAALASKLHPCLDASSEARAKDFEKKSGEPIEGLRVQDGKVQDAAWFGLDKLADFTVVERVASTLEARLGRAFLLGSGAVRDSERTTATEIMRVTVEELEGELGGVYAAIADSQQIPLHDRVVAVLERDGRLNKLDSNLVDIRPNTGIAALSREADAQRLLRFFDNIARLPQAVGEVITRRLNDEVLLKRLARDAGINEPGLIKTPEELQREAAEAAQQQLQLAAAGKAIDTAGNIAENNATTAA